MTTPSKKKHLPKVEMCKQYELFTNFFGTGEYSNTADLWDAVPKNSVSARKQAAMRDENGRLPIFKHEFEHAGVACRLELIPALLEGEDGEYRNYYPSVDEELIEEVLRKIFTDQRFGVHDAFESESWVKFSLSMIRTELKARGKTRSLNEIKKSLDVMTLTNVRIYVGQSRDPVYTGSIFSDVVRVTRQAYVEDGQSMWAARLPALVSKSVNDHSYRQFNYGILMGLKTPFSRWLHKRLSQRYVNTSSRQPYSIKLSSLRRDSGLLPQTAISRIAKTAEASFDELVEADVLAEWSKEERKGSKSRLEDVLYTLYGSMTFTAEMRKMNKRHKEIAEELRPSRQSGRNITYGKR